MKVTVIIPNYNGKHFLKPCLDSLKTQTLQDFHTVSCRQCILLTEPCLPV